MSNRTPLLARLGLHRPELRAWAMYDWAVSSVQTTVMVAVFPIFFLNVVAADLAPGRGSQSIALANSVATAIVALTAPLLGAIADYTARRKGMLSVTIAVGAACVAGMFFLQRGSVSLAFALFVGALVASATSLVFYGALLPHIASEEEMDRVSTAGYGIGYLGGGVLLALNLAVILQPGLIGLPSGDGLSPAQQTLPARLALASVALWWIGFSIPLFRRVREPARRLEAQEAVEANPLGAALRRLRDTARELRSYKQAFLMLVAFLIYNDGVQTIIKMATAYGTELGIGQGALIGAVLLVQFVGVPFAFAFGALAGRVGTRPAIFVGLGVYLVISILGFYMRTAAHFFLLAGLVGMVQGGTQALSRSLFASLIPPHKSGEFFGFFGAFERFAGLFGTLVYAAVIQATGTSRYAILSVILFFIIGGLLLTRVDVDGGRRAAREVERAAREPRPIDEPARM